MHRLKDLREDADLKQREIAEVLGCDQATYSRYETGKLDIPTDILKKLAEYYNVSIDYIMGLTNDRKPYNRGNLEKN